MAALIIPTVPLSMSAAGAAAQDATGLISGVARTAAGQPMRGFTVQLRDMQTGQVARTTVTDSQGQFSFGALTPGDYAIELLNAAGDVVAASAPMLLTTASTMVASGVIVTVPASNLVAAAAGGSFFGSTLGIVTAAAIGAGVVGVTVASTSEEASPSR